MGTLSDNDAGKLFLLSVKMLQGMEDAEYTGTEVTGYTGLKSVLQKFMTTQLLRM